MLYIEMEKVELNGINLELLRTRIVFPGGHIIILFTEIEKSKLVSSTAILKLFYL